MEIKRNGIGADGKSYKDKDLIISKLTNASWDRVFVIFDAIQIGTPPYQYSIDGVTFQNSAIFQFLKIIALIS